MRCRAITSLAEALLAYIDAAGIAEDRKGWLFRTWLDRLKEGGRLILPLTADAARGHKADTLSDLAMNQSDAC